MEKRNWNWLVKKRVVRRRWPFCLLNGFVVCYIAIANSRKQQIYSLFEPLIMNFSFLVDHQWFQRHSQRASFLSHFGTNSLRFSQKSRPNTLFWVTFNVWQGYVYIVDPLRSTTSCPILDTLVPIYRISAQCTPAKPHNNSERLLLF
jgi:hypothetical protein